MSHIQLHAYIDPGMAEALIRVQREDDKFVAITGVIDTGAEVCLFPIALLEQVAHCLSKRGKIVVEQAGIAHQAFEATEAIVRLFLEDRTGNQTKMLEVPVWFANTKEVLIGWDGILDRATLHIDMRESRSGWIEIDA